MGFLVDFGLKEVSATKYFDILFAKFSVSKNEIFKISGNCKPEK